jgi:hypothetical protein
MKQLFTVLYICFSFLVHGQTFEVGTNKYTFNGNVSSIIKDNSGNTYVGGLFTTVGLWSGGFAKLNTTIGQNDNSFVKVGGTVYTVVPIPSGGWYIGGDFTTVNGIVRNRLARINADGTLHAFDPNMSSTVLALALDGSGNLYVGGDFATVGGSSSRNYLCKFDNTGTLTSFNPSMSGRVSSLALDGSGNLYVGGSFTTVGGSTTRNYLCKFDNTGTLTSFNPSMSGSVISLALDVSGNLYAGGTFRTVGGSTARNRLCKFDNTGALTSFNPNMDNTVSSLALDGSGNLYVGGGFITVGIITRNRLCKFDNIGVLTSFDPNMSSVVSELALDGSGNLYAGGLFKTVGSTTRNHLCKFDNTGALTSFDPNMSSNVSALALDDSGNLYAGGAFTFVGGGTTRNRLCKFDNTGALTSFDPNMSNDISALAVDGSGNLYAGGWFTKVGSITRNRLCKFDNTGTLTSFDPNMSSNVSALALDGSGNLYAGGQFTTVGGSTIRNRLCKFDNTGSLTSFDPNINNSVVFALALDGSGNLYVGGGFTTVGGSTTRNRLCKFDNTGALTSFDPNMNNAVNTLALDGGGNLYAGGSFTIVGGSTTRNRLCKFDNTGALTSFDPNINNSVVIALALDGSGNLYVGGSFTTVGGSTTRNRLCKFDNTGALTSFDPNMINTVNSLALDGSGNLYAGGVSGYFSIFTVPSPPTISSFSPTSGIIGTTVTITGTNFNTTAEQNIVFFGATKATVTAASTTSLKVTVPVGATYEPISVLNLGTTFMANSATPFRVTFAGGAISATSFKPEVRFNTGNTSFNSSIGDLDGDGKPDLVVPNYSGNTISVFRNISSSGSISSSSFESKVEFTTGNYPSDVGIGDLDGDGKPDLVVTSYFSSDSGSSISVLRNTASSGSINSSSFASKVDFVTEAESIGVSIGDLDGDGKPELAVANYGGGVGNTISIFHNTSSSGSINSSSFASKVDFTVGYSPYNVSIGDLDGDGKPDLIVANTNADNISVLRNTASRGSINSRSFDAKVDFTTGSSSSPYPYGLTIGDLDGDEKPDLVVANFADGNISVLRNTASSGSITSSSFASRVNFVVGFTNPYSVSIGDLDGDGKPDLVVPSFGFLHMFRNTASTGSITNSSFASRLDIPTSAYPASIKIGDLDGDGKPDLVASDLSGSGDIFVIHNYQTPSTAPPTITPPASLSVCSPSTLTLTASGCAGTVTWSQGAATGTSLTLSAVGTYSITATCTVAGVTSAASTAVTGLEIKAKPNAPTITPPTSLSVFTPSTLTLTASGCAGTVTWSQGAATGTSLTLSTLGTYSITATCTVNGCISDASTAVTGLEIIVPSPPTISSFSPTSGIIGTTVTITGTNFNATANQNIVFFGATKATVTAASTTSLTVTVPTGATYQAISVLNLGTTLMANSATPFRVTFAGGAISATSFAPNVTFNNGDASFSTSIGDLDGDGKPDLVVTNFFGSNNISVFRNISSSGSISSSSFESKVNFTTGYYPIDVSIGDLDGDGKPDLVVANYDIGSSGNSSISILRNTASSGIINSSSFASKVDLITTSIPAGTAIGDLDGDGKPDLAVANYGGTTISIFHNTSSSGSITSSSFASKVDFTVGNAPFGLSIGDLDGDGKPDLVVSNSAADNISVLRNTASSGSINSSSFASKVDFTTGSSSFSNPYFMTIGDLDGDNKPDLVVANFQDFNFSVFRNTASSGSITSSSFASRVNFDVGSSIYGVSIGDLDGDGKPDLVAPSLGGYFSVFRNTASSGSITNSSFANRVDITRSAQSADIKIGDLDGDGKPDLVAGDQAGFSIAVIRNGQTPSTAPPTITPPASLSVCSPSTLMLTASGCAGTVTWSQGAATGTSLTLSAVGTYSITATCTVAGSTSVASTAVTGLEIKAPVSVTAASQTNISCNGGSNGAASINTPTGGAGGYTYSWSPSGGTATTATGLSVGTYTVTVTGANSCTATQRFTITQPTAISTSTVAQTNVSCNGGSNGSASVTPSGGAGGYTYLWSPSGGTAATASGLSAGTYTVTVTDANACTATQSFTITQPTAITVTAASQTNIACFGGSSGAATINTPTGGTAGYAYSWSPSGGTATTATGLSAGTYTVTVTDANACTATQSFTITQLTAISTSTAAQTNVSCNGGSNGSATVTPSGGTGGYTYSWSPSGGTAATATGLSAGTYTVTVTDANACTATRNYTITQPPIVTAPIITSPVSLVVCSPSTLTLIASGCAGTVTWSNAAIGSSLTLSTVGNYSISATCTVNGCISDPSTAVTGLEIKAKPSAPTVTAPTAKVVCFPSTLTLTASGCAGTVTWSNAAIGSSLTLSTVGNYSISATCTVNGCISDPSTTVTGLEIKAQPIISSSNTGPYTIGQTISLTGTGIGTYNWTGPNNFRSTLSNPTINNALSVNAGVYTLSVSGLNSCIATSTTNVVVNEIGPCDPTRIVEFIYVKAGNPYQPLFQLTDGMVINQIRDQVSILVNPVCSSVTIESMEMNIQGPELNWNVLKNVTPNALFDNIGLDFYGRNFNPGNYTLTVTGYARDNKGGGITYGPKIIRFTVVGNLATINAPTLSKLSICAGSSVDVTFGTTGTFNGVNQFQVELSDSSGSFEKPLLIGTTNVTGTTTCLIPQNTLGGSKYLIRVISSNQVVVSNPVISQVTVNPLNYSLVSPTNNLTGTSTKKAIESINASNKITSPANVVYEAGKSVLLTPGFESGAVFRAEVKSCDN